MPAAVNNIYEYQSKPQYPLNKILNRFKDIRIFRFQTALLWVLSANPVCQMERIKGVEPSQSVWETNMLTVTLYPQIWWSRRGIEPASKTYTLINSFYAIADFAPWQSANHNFI